MLRIAGLKTVDSELANTESASEEASAVARRLQMNDPDTAEHCSMKLHGIVLIVLR